MKGGQLCYNIDDSLQSMIVNIKKTCVLELIYYQLSTVVNFITGL